MSDQYIVKLFYELKPLVRKLILENEYGKLNENESIRFHELLKEVRDYLIENPGEIIYIKDTHHREFTSLVAGAIQSLYNDDNRQEYITELSLDFHTGERADFTGNFLYPYVKRVLKIKPLFVSDNRYFDSKFENYFKEATRAWLYGLDTAALVLCVSLLEDVLRNKLCFIDVNYALKLVDNRNRSNHEYGLQEIKKFAEWEGLLTKPLVKKLGELQKNRNAAVHNLNMSFDFDVIEDTKEILEYLINN